MNTYVNMGLWPLKFVELFQHRERLYTSESDVYKRQILTVPALEGLMSDLILSIPRTISLYRKRSQHILTDRRNA